MGYTEEPTLGKRVYVSVVGYSHRVATSLRVDERTKNLSAAPQELLELTGLVTRWATYEPYRKGRMVCCVVSTGATLPTQGAAWRSVSLETRLYVMSYASERFCIQSGGCKM